MVQLTTQQKGDIAVAKVITDLTQKGYYVLSPSVCEALRFDLVAYKDGKFIRIQAKYASKGNVQCKTISFNSKGSCIKVYKATDFDYYGIYLPNIDKVVYPSIKFGGIRIASVVSNSATPFYWYEDFLSFTNKAKKRTYKEFGKNIKPTRTPDRIEADLKKRTVEWPSKKELEKLLWTKPATHIAKDYGVSDVAVSHWAKVYGLTKPPQGYWRKLKHGKI